MSARALDALRDDGFYAVGGVVGLYLCIRGNSRCWMLRIVVEGRRRELGLGSYPEVSLALARDRAWARRRAYRASDIVEAQHTPQEMRKDATRFTAMTEPTKREEKSFAFCAKTYIAAQAPGWKSDKHAKQWTSSLERYAYPVIGNLLVSAIDNDHLLQILRPRVASFSFLLRKAASCAMLPWGGSSAGCMTPIPEQADQGIWTQCRIALPLHMAFGRPFATGQRKLPCSRAK